MSLPTEILLSLVEAKPVMAGVVGGIAGALILGLSSNEAIMFAGTTALGVSLGDAILTGAGYATEIRSYLDGGFSTYFDPMDFVGGGSGVLLINLALGVRGRPLAILTGAAAVAGGVAPKLSTKLFTEITQTNQTLVPAKTGSNGPGGASVRG